MSVWSRNRQFTVLFTFFFIFIMITAFGLYQYLKKPPSCSDGKHNQSELEIDCGGPCEKVCQLETTPLIPLWNRVFPVKKGIFDVGAFLENHNSAFGVPSINYLIKIYDKDNVLLKEIRNSTYVNPQERFVIYESAIDTGASVPARAVLQLDQAPTWKRFPAYKPFTFVVRNKVIELDDSPTVSAELVNGSLYDANNVEAVAIIYDKNGNAVAGSKTYIEGRFPKDSAKNLVFTWPEKIIVDSPYVEIYARASQVNE